MFKDRPVDPLENAVYWTEYALRHDTQLLMPMGVHQSWWQRRLIDVWAFLILVTALLFGLVIYCSYMVMKVLFVRFVIGGQSSIKTKKE